jgi:hypothetical protein
MVMHGILYMFMMFINTLGGSELSMETSVFGQALSNDSEDCDINATLAIHSHWIYVSFGDCVVNSRQYLSFFIGLLSILSWICAQLP